MSRLSRLVPSLRASEKPKSQTGRNRTVILTRSHHLAIRGHLVVASSGAAPARELPSSRVGQKQSCATNFDLQGLEELLMIAANILKDVAALVVVVLLLPSAMYGMRGHSTAKTKLASAVSLVGLAATFIIVSFGLLYSSIHKIDYAAAVHTELPMGVHGVCANRIKPVSDKYVSGKSHMIITFSGHLTGGGWLREVMKDFASEEGLTFATGRPEHIDCNTDVYHVDSYSELGLLRLQEPYKGVYVVRDPRSIVAELWISMSDICLNVSSTVRQKSHPEAVFLDRNIQKHLAPICSMNKDSGLSFIISWLKKHGCSGPLKSLCVAASIPAKVAFSRGIRVVQYESLWSKESSGLTDVGLWIGLQGSQLRRFVSIGRMWLERFHALSAGGGSFAARRGEKWKKHISKEHVQQLRRKFKKEMQSVGYM